MMDLGYDLVSEILGELSLLKSSHINRESSVGVWTEDMRRFYFAVVEEVKVEQIHQRAGAGKFMISTSWPRLEVPAIHMFLLIRVLNGLW